MVGQIDRSNGRSERSVKRSVRTVGQAVGQNGRSNGRSSSQSERSVKRSVRTVGQTVGQNLWPTDIGHGHDRSWPVMTMTDISRSKVFDRPVMTDRLTDRFNRWLTDQLTDWNGDEC